MAENENDLEQELKNFQLDTISWFSKKGSLNFSAKEFISSESKSIFNLVNGKFAKYRFNGHCKVLLGSIGAGKTTFCKDLQEYFSIAYKSLLVSYNDYGTNFNATPSQLIYNAISRKYSDIPESNNVSIEEVENILEDKNIFCFLILDEFSNVFKGIVSKGKDIILEAKHIGGLFKGRIHCILTGSSPLLRQLCFGKLSLPQTNYPNYTGLKFNSTKYQPIWLYPFLEKNSFEDICRFFKLTPNSQLYYQTGGVPRLLLAAKLSSDEPHQYTISVKDYLIKTPYSSVLNSLLQVTQAYGYPEDEAYSDTNDLIPYWWCNLIDYSSFIETLNEKFPADKGLATKSVLYELTDKCIIRYIDTAAMKIGFGSPLVYLQCASQNGEISAIEAAALRFPSGTENEVIAEICALKCISQFGHNSSKLFDQKLATLFYEAEQFFITSEKSEQTIPSEGILYKELYKPKGNESKDTMGADGVVYFKTNDSGLLPSFISYRIQLKLMDLKFEKVGQCIQKAVENFKTKHKLYLDTIKKNEMFSIKKEVWIIAITSYVPLKVFEDLEQEASKIADEYNATVKILEGWQLTHYVWNNSIKAVHRKYNLSKPIDVDSKRKFQVYFPLD